MANFARYSLLQLAGEVASLGIRASQEDVDALALMAHECARDRFVGWGLIVLQGIKQIGQDIEICRLFRQHGSFLQASRQEIS